MSEKTYPTGQPYPARLPNSYHRAEGDEKCGNCRFYDKGYCNLWAAPVWYDYWCRAWKK